MYIISIYILLCILILKTMVFKRKCEKDYSNYLYIFIILLFLFRFNLGADTESYIFFFERVENPILDSFKYVGQRNLGFNIMLYFSKVVYNDYRFFVFIFNLIVLSICSFTVYKNSKNFGLSIMLFIGSGILEIYYSSALRQMVAMSIFFFAFYHYLKNKQYAKYYIFCIISCLFHETAMITLFIPLITLMCKFIKKYEFKFIFITTMMSLFLSFIVEQTLIYLSHNINANSTIEHILGYFSATNFSIIGVIFRIILFGVIYILYKSSSSNQNNKWVQVQVYTCFFAMIIYLSLSSFSVTSRISDFIDIICIVLIPNLFVNLKKESTYKIIVLFMFVFIINLATLYADISFKLDYITGIENAQLNDYKYISIFDDDSKNYFEDK